MKVLEQLARGMCEKAGHNPDRQAFSGPLESGPHGTWFPPARDRMSPLWRYYSQDAANALELLKDLIPNAED